MTAKRVIVIISAYKVVNYGVEGHGMLHAFLQLREALSTQPPAADNVCLCQYA